MRKSDLLPLPQKYPQCQCPQRGIHRGRVNCFYTTGFQGISLIFATPFPKKEQLQSDKQPLKIPTFQNTDRSKVLSQSENPYLKVKWSRPKG